MLEILYLGGTGKTPLSREIFDISKSLNKNPAFIKKPYAYLNDEIKMLEKNHQSIYLQKKRFKVYNYLLTIIIMLQF